MFRAINQKRRPAKRALGIESMERRELMAGDFTEFPTLTEAPQTTPNYWVTGTPNNTLNSATYIGTVLTTVTRTGEVGGSGDPVDHWRFRVGETGNTQTNIRLAGMSQDLDIYILDFAGRELARGTQGSTTAESVTVNLVAGREYYVKVVPYTFNNVASNYRLTINVSNNTIATPSSLGTLASTPLVQQGSVGGNDPCDFYRMRVATSGSVRIQLSGLTRDLDVQVFDSSGVLIASGARGGTTSEDFRVNLTAGRDYFIKVVPYGFAQNADGSTNIPVSNYELRVSR